MKVIKKNNTLENWDNSKIVEAIKKAADRLNNTIDTNKSTEIAEYVKSIIKGDLVKTLDLHKIVINALKTFGYFDIAQSYQDYRDYKTSYAKSWEEIKEESDRILYLGDTENANFDSSLISTKRSLIQGALTKELYKNFYLNKELLKLIKRGDIYIHDLRDMMLNSINCCLFDIGNVLKNGFEMSNVTYTEPKSVLAALQVIGDVTLVASAQQFGGFTLPEIDKVLLPYCKKTWKRAFDYMYNNLGQEYEIAEMHADTVLKRELEQGFQSLELKLNTVPSSRGDFAFTTITFGQWNTNLPNQDREILALICETILKVRQQGHGGKPVLFPKLVYLYDEDQIKFDHYSSEVFEKCVECSSKCMYPDYLSLSGSPLKNKVAQEFKQYHRIISPMGCRAYLSHWEDPETGKAIVVGRCNIGAVSLNLPLILAIAHNLYPDSWEDAFYKLLEARLNNTREFFKIRYETIANTKASTNPLAFTQGGFYKGNLKLTDKIGNLVKYMTASFGITALNEFTRLWTRFSNLKEVGIYENNSIAKEVVNFILDKVESFKKEDGYLYALYGTPAESLCKTQADQYRAYTGDNSLGEFFSNSFHCHVSEDINPIQKQDSEEAIFHLINGGHIQYIRLDNPDNLEAVKCLIKRGMDLGFYQGVNFDSVYCQDCGKHATNSLLKCPHCNSKNITVISRVCGYLGYSNINGQSRMNSGKMTEIFNRKSM